MPGLIRFEMGNLLRAPSVWMLLVACLGFGFMVPVDELGPGMQALDLWANYRAQYFVGLSSLITPIAMMVAIPLSFHRDATHRFESIALGCPWEKRFWPKWLVIITFLLGCLAAVPLGMALSLGYQVDEPMSWFAWLFTSVLPAWFWLSTANAFAIMAIMVWASYRWTNAFSPYVSGFAFLLLFWLGQVLTGMPVLGIAPIIDTSRWFIASLLDPFGLSSFFQVTAYWTVNMKNHEAFPFTHALLVNRTIWLVIAACSLWRATFWARQPLRLGKAKPRTEKESPTQGFLHRSDIRQVSRPGFLFPGIFLNEMRATMVSWPWLCCMVMWSILCVLGLLMVFGTFSNGVSPRLPSTSLILSYSGEPLFVFGLAMAVVFSAAMLWRERRVGFEGLLASLPCRNGSLLFSKVLTLNLLFAAMIMVMVGIGWGYQLWVGYAPIDVHHWLLAGYVFGFPLFVQGTLIFVVQFIAFAKRAHPLTGMGVSACFSIAIHVIPRKLEWRHPLLNPFSFPNLLRRHSEMRGYGQWGDLFDHMALLWGLALIPFLIMAWKAWPRPEPGPARWRGGLVLGSAVWMVVAGWTGLVFHKNRPISAGTELQAKADYEKRFGHLAGQGVPQVVHSYNEVALYPEEHRLEVSARYQVKNTLDEAIETLLITARNPLKQVQFGIPFRRIDDDPVLNASLIQFVRPWLPGETLTFSYQTTLNSTVFAINPAFGRKGSYFLQTHFEPVLGYYEGLEIRDPHVRASLGLPKKAFRPQDRHTLYGRFVQNKRTFETLFSTTSDQTPLTSGDQIETYVRGGRRTARFEARTPIYPVVGYFSGNYEVESFEAQGIPVSVYTHPGHRRNMSQIIGSIRATMDYCNQFFGPYPYRSLRVIEIPATFRTGGRASAGIIALNENGLFMLDPDPGRSVHTVIRRTVHEVVHQWFGEKLVPKIANGERVLNESITKYVESMIVARMLGPDMVRTMNLANGHRYFSGRSRDSREVPLVEANHYYLCYGKGALVFQGLAEAWGERQLNQVLRSFMEEHRQGMTATMPDLVARMLAEIGPDQRHWVENGFLRRVTYEFSLEEVQVVRNETGTWLDLLIQAKGEDRDDLGKPREHDLDVPLQIGLSDGDPRRDLSTMIHETIRISSGLNTYRVRVAQVPKYVVLDPLARQLESDRTDNELSLPEFDRGDRAHP